MNITKIGDIRRIFLLIVVITLAVNPIQTPIFAAYESYGYDSYIEDSYTQYDYTVREDYIKDDYTNEEDYFEENHTNDDYYIADDENTLEILYASDLVPFLLDGTGGTVFSGETVYVEQNIVGEIIVDGGTLHLDENYTITGTVTVINSGSFYMSAGTITGLGTRGVTVTGVGSTFEMSGGRIEGNTSGSSGIDGGGVYVSVGGRFEMSGDAIITGNEATRSGGGVGLSGALTSFIMTGGYISHNHATGSGGGIQMEYGAYFRMYGGTIDNNISVLSGGAVSSYGGIFNLMDGDIHSNIAHTLNHGGGALRLMSNAEFNMYGGRIHNNSLSGNLATGGGISISGATMTMRGGHIFNNSSVHDGGGIDIRGSGSSLTIYDGIIGHEDLQLGNRAVRDGGGISINNATVIMSDGHIFGNTAIRDGGGISIQSATMIMSDGHIFGNTARDGAGIEIRGTIAELIIYGGTIGHDNPQLGNGAGRDGGGIRVTARASVTFPVGTTGRIVGNRAINGGGVSGLGNSPGIPTLFTMYDGQIYNNSATNGGGVHFASNYAVFDFLGGTIGHENPALGNEASVNGGGVWLGGGSSPVLNMPSNSTGSILGNNAGTNGGGIHLHPNVDAVITFTMEGGQIYNNRANNGGGVNLGGVASGTASFTMEGGQIHNNSAVVNGGGIHLGMPNTTASIHRGFIIDNHAYEDGGGIWTINHYYHHLLPTGAYGNLTVSEDVVFNGNRADNGCFRPPINWEDTDIRGDGTSPTIEAHGVHQLNNHDVNFRALYPSLTKDVVTTEDVDVGDTIEYSIIIINDHNSPLEGNFTVVDELDTALIELIGNSITVTRNGIDLPATEVTIDLSIAGIIRIVLHDLPANSETIINFEVLTLPASAGQTVRNSAVIHRPGSGIGSGETPDPNPIRTPETEKSVEGTEPDPENPANPTNPIDPEEDTTNPDDVGYIEREDTPEYPMLNAPSTPIFPYIPLSPLYPEPILEIPFNPIHHAYMIGDNHGYIRPNGNITRAEMATIFFRLITDEYRTEMWMQTNPFSDVQLNYWFNNAVSTMTNAGVITGMPNGTFEPHRAITRAEFAAVMTRFFTGLPMDGANMFPDIEGHWAAAEINAVARMGWVAGFPDGTFAPNQAITRAEVAALINRILQRLPETVDDLLVGMIEWPDNMDTNAWFYLYIQEATNSNYYNLKSDSIHKRWIALTERRCWQVLELPVSNPWDIIGNYCSRLCDFLVVQN